MNAEEKTAVSDQNTDRAAIVPAPDKALTIPEKRLAGSPRCRNCNTPLQGPFCHYCGQPDKNLMRFFPALMRELLEDFLDFDSRFFRTLRPLLFQPGKLTRDYLDGRRFRYVTPLRLYLFSSIVFFFLAALLTSDQIKVETAATDSGGVEAPLTVNVHPEGAATDQPADEAPEDDSEVTDTITINGEPWDRETNPFIISWLPERANDWINDEIGESPKKGREIGKNPNLIVDKMFDVLPVTMFVLLPLVALLLKFWYLFAKKYYVEHLVFALHVHAFLFVVLTIIMLANALAAWQEAAGREAAAAAASWITTAFMLWVPAYVLIAMKRVYRQGWGMTLVKFCVVSISYLVLLGLATAIVAVVSFVML